LEPDPSKLTEDGVAFVTICHNAPFSETGRGLARLRQRD
jgi:hypothetical protein